MAIGVQTDMSTPALARFGSEYVCNNFLKPSVTGDFVSCIGVSEPHAGSDVAAIKTNAVKDGDDYIINGSKMWITNGTQADWMCMLANTESKAENKHLNKSLICVPLKNNGERAKGVTINRKLKKMGMHSSDTAEIFFEDVRVPSKNLIGEEGKGFIYQMMQFQEERLYAAIGNYAGCELAIAETIEYTRQRKTFGKAINQHQVIAFKLADMATDIEAARLLVQKSAYEKDNHESYGLSSSMAKLFASEMAMKHTVEAVQIHGGYGFVKEYHVERLMRDAKITQIYEGTSEIQKIIISRSLLK